MQVSTQPRYELKELSPRRAHQAGLTHGAAHPARYSPPVRKDSAAMPWEETGPCEGRL
jgi:hypothetical protein